MKESATQEQAHWKVGWKKIGEFCQLHLQIFYEDTAMCDQISYIPAIELEQTRHHKYIGNLKTRYFILLCSNLAFHRRVYLLT